MALSLAGAVLVAAIGYGLVRGSIVERSDTKARPLFGWVQSSLGEGLARLSYDLPFIVRARRAPGELPPACIIYLDEGSAAKLAQRGGVWDRQLHADLVRRLKREGARAIFFDIVFSDPWPDPAVDADFAEAIAEHGNVFLGAALELDYGANAFQERTVPPTPVLRKSAAGWGLIAFRPLDPDFGVRRIFSGTEQVPSATWRAALALGAKLPQTDDGRMEARWLNFYGPPNTFPNVSYDRALRDNEVPPDFFRDKVVFIGGRSTLGSLMLGKDDFRTPYGLFGEQFAHGVELHLTILQNLLRGEWLTRLAPSGELWFVVVFGVLLGGGLPWLRPHWAAVAALLAAAVLAAVAWWLHAHRQVWFAWCIPALVQVPLALVWAVFVRYFVEERRRRALRDAFGLYLSPQMADRIAEADFDLKPGGAVVDCTVIFTDLEDYTGLCQRMDDPLHISRVLTTYFTHTTGHILDSDGTIIKYMGDAVQAVWGAPLKDADHVRKAVRAAWRMHVASRIECEGHPLRTRIGVNTGPMIAGNLGSAQRFDYTVTGDAVNFASRLEGLNKFLGTDVLLSDSIFRALDTEFLTRPLGDFLVAGRKEPRLVHELLGPADGETRPWLATFARALAAFQAGDLDAAERGMRETVAQRGGADGPATMYLVKIAEYRLSGLPADWRGVIEFGKK